MNLMMSREKSIRSIRQEVIMIRIHKTSYKETINVVNIEDIKIVKQGCGMSKVLSFTYHSDDTFLQKEKPV